MCEISKETLQAEFKHIIGVTYLDHAGAALYSSRQLSDHVSELGRQLYSNPHSGSPSSRLTTSLVDDARETVLSHFNTNSDHYHVVFTASCTAALSLLSRTFPWQRVTTPPPSSPPTSGGGGGGGGRSLFCYLDDNHTSVVGMREVARERGAKTVCVSPRDIRPPAESNSKPRPTVTPTTPTSNHPPPHHLFAYPAQSNFSGRKYPLSWCEGVASGHLLVHSRGDEPPAGGGTWWGVLDAAALVSTSPLDLSACRPHFVTLSFYKMFGFPTGLGALLVRRDSAHLLSKPYYGGGTVKATDSWTDFHVLRDQLHERLEDGTLPFLEILALRHGFATLNRLCHSMPSIQHHTFTLARMVYDSLSELRHENGRKVCVLYCETGFQDQDQQGPIVNFNLLRASGEVLGYHQVEKLAAACDIHLRTGCFCNTGACMRHLALTSQQLRTHLQHGHVCGDSVDVIDGRPTGSVRVSFGYASTLHDVEHFLTFIRTCFLEQQHGGCLTNSTSNSTSNSNSNSNSNTTSNTTSNSTSNTTSNTTSNSTSNITSNSTSNSNSNTENAGSNSELEQMPHQSALLRKPGKSDGFPLDQDSRQALQLQHPIDTIGTSTSCNAASSSSLLLLTCGDTVQVDAGEARCRLRSITLYPVKSCAGFGVQRWPVGEKGLMLDREWMVRTEQGSLLSQKQEPRLCLIHPHLDLESSTLTLTAEGHEPVTLSASHFPPSTSTTTSDSSSSSLSMRVCGDRVEGTDCGEEVGRWLTAVLGRKCRLVRQNAQHKRSRHGHAHNHTPATAATAATGPIVRLSLANEAQFLLLTLNSLEHLLGEVVGMAGQQGLWAGLDADALATRFRANFVVESREMKAYSEEAWEQVRISNHLFQVTGTCTRCRMICVDPKTGRQSPELLKTLLACRGSRAYFGVYLSTST